MPLFRRILIISEQILKKITYFLSKYNPFNISLKFIIIQNIFELCLPVKKTEEL